MPNQDHLKIKANHIDPDDGISWLCTACNLPIFATPFTGGGAAPLLHDQCADLPAELKNSELHPQQLLFLRDNNNDEICSECSQKCGSKLYYCQDSGCDLVLDVACALPVKILHRSHHHRLIAIRGGTDGSCGVCGVAHKTTASSAEARSYSCSVCGFWIHPDCATSANVIQHEKHVHPLVLYYDVAETFGAQYSTPLDLDYFASLEYEGEDSTAPPQTQKNDNGSCSRCAICGNGVGKKIGVFSCIKCRDCIFHVSCATSDRRSFKHVLSREARFPSLVRLPMRDEHQSIVRETTRRSDGDQQNSVEFAHMLATGIDNRHPFILHDDQIKFDEDVRVCDACLKIIDNPPFYSCSKCPNMFFHDYCYSLPPFLSGNPAHTHGHNFFFGLLEDVEPYMEGITCLHCGCPHIRACYACGKCTVTGTLDVSCALMPEVVTHEAHGTAHFLRLSDSSSRRIRDPDCVCCLRPLGMLAYECRTCQNFVLHTWCAMLPKTVTHKFDPHPLQLTTNTCVTDICEICENWIEEKVWRYNCKRCEQSFHVDCIPCLDILYKIKSLVSCGQIGHDNVPKRLIRGLTLQGHGHGHEYCRDVADEYDDIFSSE